MTCFDNENNYWWHCRLWYIHTYSFLVADVGSEVDFCRDLSMLLWWFYDIMNVLWKLWLCVNSTVGVIYKVWIKAVLHFHSPHDPVRMYVSLLMRFDWINKTSAARGSFVHRRAGNGANIIGLTLPIYPVGVVSIDNYTLYQHQEASRTLLHKYWLFSSPVTDCVKMSFGAKALQQGAVRRVSRCRLILIS